MYENINYLATRAEREFSKLVEIARRNWGLNSRVLLVMYRGVIESTLLYGVVCWGSREA